MPKKLIAGLLLGLSAAAFVLLLGRTGLLEVQELRTYDWRIAQTSDPASVRSDIVLVEITDASVRDLAPLVVRWPWPRVTLAMAIDFLSRAPAKLIAIDLLALEPDNRLAFQFGSGTMSGKESDAELVRSVTKAGNVVMVADAVYLGTVGEQQARKDEWTAPPFRLGPAIEERPLIT